MTSPDRKESRRGLAALIGLTLALLVSACGGGSGAGAGGANGSGAVPAAVGTSATVHALGLPVTLEAALTSGDAGASTLADVNTGAQILLDAQRSDYAMLKSALFGLNADGSASAASLAALDWDPSHDSSWFSVLDRVQNKPILASNWSFKGGTAGTSVTLAVAGVHLGSNGRYAAFGGNPLGLPGNAAMDALMRNSVAWLTRKRSTNITTGAPGLKIVTAHLPGTETYWFPHEAKVRAWFASNYPGVSINGVSANPAAQADDRCDGAKLAACLQPGADLLVLGREQGPAAYDGAAVMRAVSDAQARGIPVLYLHHDRDSNDLSTRLLDYFGLAQVNNYWECAGRPAWSKW
jgi:hypothetical protein